MNPTTSGIPEPGASNLETSGTLKLVEPELEPRNLWNQINLELQIVGISRTCETYKPLKPVEPWTQNCNISVNILVFNTIILFCYICTLII